MDFGSHRGLKRDSVPDALAFTTETCLGVNPRTGERPPLSHPEREPDLPAARPVPGGWRTAVLGLIALFESGRRDIATAYANVSATDVLSLGFLQWNHNTGSCIVASCETSERRRCCLHLQA
jgi:hypothetical protein